MKRTIFAKKNRPEFLEKLITLKMLCISDNCGDKLPAKKENALARVNKSFLTLLLGLLFVSAMNRPGYMSYQTATQSLEPASAARLKSLVADMHPTTYLIQAEITTSGEGAPVVAICDAASVNMLYGNNPTLSQVELVKITVNSINDLPASIDLAKLKGLAELKYLLVEFAYDACGGRTEGCINSIVGGIIEGNSSQITVIYSLSIPE